MIYDTVKGLIWAKRPNEILIFFEISDFLWRHFVVTSLRNINYVIFDDSSLIFYFSLGFLNSTFKSFEKISHFGFYWACLKSPKSFHFSNFHENLWFSPKIVILTEIRSFLERYFLASNMLDTPASVINPLVIFGQGNFEFCNASWPIRSSIVYWN